MRYHCVFSTLRHLLAWTARGIALALACALLLVALPLTPAHAQDVVLAKDDASDTVYDDDVWAGGDNGGSGFGAWTLQSDGSNSGHFIGDSQSLAAGSGGGDVNTAGESFGMFGHSGETSQAFRDLPRALQAGDVLTFEIAVNFRNGSKGVNFRNGSGSSEGNFEVANNRYTLFGNDLFSNAYNANTVFTITLTQKQSELDWTVERSGGASGTESGTESISPGTIAELEFFVSNTDNGNAENNLFFNSLQVTNTEVIRSVGTGNWSTPGSWSTGAVPGTGDEVIISNGHTVTLDTDATIRAIEIESGATFTGSDGTARTLTLTDDDTGALAARNGATFTNNGTFDAGTGTLTVQQEATLTNNSTFDAGTGKVVFDAGATLTSGLTLYDAEIGGDVNLGGSTIENSLQINFNGFASSSPTYGSGATLIYAVGDAYTQTNEWPSSNEPPTVRVKDGTTLNLQANRGTTTLDVESGAEVNLGAQEFTLRNNGTLTVDGTFNANSSTVILEGSASLPSPGVSFHNLQINTEQDLSGQTITNTLTLNGNSASVANGGTPTYDTATLAYAQDNAVTVTADEWPNTAGPDLVDVLGTTAVTLNATRTLSGIGDRALRINAGATFTVSDGRTLAVGNGVAGTAAGDGTLTMNGTLQIDTGGFVLIPPTYGSNATLRYNSGNVFGRAVEWSSNSGSGYPTNVRIAGGTTLDLGANSGQNIERQMAGSLTIENGGTLTMNGNGNEMTEALVVLGDLYINTNATLELSSVIGGDLRLEGDWTNAGTFTANDRAVSFVGSGNQNIINTTSSDLLEIPFVILDKANDTDRVILDSDMDIAGLLTLSSGELDVATNNHTLRLLSTETRSAFITGSADGSVSGEVTMQRFVGKDNNASHFRFLTTPFKTAIDDAGASDNAHNLLSNVWTQSAGSGGNASNVSPDQVSVYDYDESVDVQNGLTDGWTPIANLDNPVSAGTGILAFLFQNNSGAGDDGFPVTLSVTGTVTASETDGSDAGPPVTFTDNDTADEDGWNLVGNPFAAPIDWESISSNTNTNNIDATVYVWDANSNGGAGSYVTYTEGEGGTNNAARIISPFQSFFVKANAASPDLHITSNDKVIDVNNPPALQQTVTRPGLTLELRATDGSRTETASVRFSPNADSGKDRFDAYQLGSFASEYAQVAFAMDGTDALFTHHHLPPPDAQVELDLNLDITASGDYELVASRLDDIPADWNLTLEDRDTGSFYNLREGEYPVFSYDATAAAESASHTAAASVTGAARAQRMAPTVARASETSSSGLPRFRLHVGPEAPLPVELSDFTASVRHETATLRWTTESETNNAGFHVEHQTPGSSEYTDHAFVDGAGTTDEPQTYQLRVDDLTLGMHAFRLRQVDLDGTTTRHDPVEVEITLTDAYRVDAPYPNPAREQATLGFAVREAQQVTVAVYDLTGRRVHTLYQDSPPPDRLETLRLPVGTLSSGTYFIRVQGTNFTETRRLTVVR